MPVEPHPRRFLPVIARRCAAALVVSAGCWSAPAMADVVYLYTGNFFPVTDQSQVIDGTGHVQTVTTVTSSQIRAEIDTPVALQSGSTFGAGTTLSLSRYDLVDGAPSLVQTLIAPYPFSGPDDPLDTPANPLQTVTFSVGAVDGAGLPTDWSFGISQSAHLPTGRQLAASYATATAQDSIVGGYEGFDAYAGALDGRPGSWSVSVVPEPATAALLLAGLGVVVAALRRRP